MKQRDLIKLVEIYGFIYERASKHLIYKNPATGASVAIPRGKDISIGTVRNIVIAMVGGNREEAKRILREAA